MDEAPQILVTGATGFIGTHLVGKLAEEGRPTRCLVRGSSLEVAGDHLSRFGAELVYRDLTDSGSLGAATEGVTTVFHLGGGGTVQMTFGYRVTLEEVEAAEHSRHFHHSPGAVVR